MKNTNIVMIIAALCVVMMGACFSSWDGGNIIIELDESGSPPENGDTYSVSLTNTSSGEKLESSLSDDGKAVFPVQPGFWNIVVERYNDNSMNGCGAEKNVELKSGVTAYKRIKIGFAWEDLKDVIEGATGNKTIMISDPSKDITLLVTSYIQIPRNTRITLLANLPVTIKKADNGNFDNSMFRVPSSSSLTLGVAGGMSGTGTINFDGNKGKYETKSSSSLIYVGNQRIINGKHIREGNGGTLTIYDNVTLTNNRAYVTGNDRGGAVVVDGGTFYMYGGGISGNTNTDKGGGVRVLSGTFTKTGGTIFDNTAKDNQGNAVYVDSTPPRFKNGTSGETHTLDINTKTGVYNGLDNL